MTPLTRRATAVYREAAPEQVRDGEDWYPRAHRFARQQAWEYDVTIEVTAGVIAALSPRLEWSINMRLAIQMLDSGGTLTEGGLGGSLLRARTIMAGVPPLDVLNGPKSRAFYEAIITAGESKVAVIDRHAWDMLVGKRGAVGPSRRQYQEADDRMRRAARILGVPTSVCQATTWVTWRDQWKWTPLKVSTTS